jgi:hypothetical protein
MLFAHGPAGLKGTSTLLQRTPCTHTATPVALGSADSQQHAPSDVSQDDHEAASDRCGLGRCVALGRQLESIRLKPNWFSATTADMGAIDSALSAFDVQTAGAVLCPLTH